MACILRGDIFWASLNPTLGNEQAGTQPVVIISQTRFNQRSGTVIALAITSQPPRVEFPLVLELKLTQMPKQAWVKSSQVRTLSIQRLKGKLGTCHPEELSKIIQGLNALVAD